MLGVAFAILHYEWVHYVAHIPYQPRTPIGRWIKQYHLRHHFISEKFWFGVSNPAMDLLGGTYSEARDVARSATTRKLFGSPPIVIDFGAAPRSPAGRKPAALTCLLPLCVSPPAMSALSLFGLAAVTAMLIFYAVEDRSPWFVLAFAAACGWGPIVRLSAGRVAVRARGGHLGGRRGLPLACEC